MISGLPGKWASKGATLTPGEQAGKTAMTCPSKLLHSSSEKLRPQVRKFQGLYFLPSIASAQRSGRHCNFAMNFGYEDGICGQKF